MAERSTNGPRRLREEGEAADDDDDADRQADEHCVIRAEGASDTGTTFLAARIRLGQGMGS